MEKKKSVKDLLFKDGLIIIVASLGIDFLYPPFYPITLAMKVFGVSGIGFYACTFSKYDRLFKNCDLNVGLSHPILKRKEKTDYGSMIYHFTIPCGLSLKDFEDKKEAIEAYIGTEIKLEYTFKELTIEEYAKDEKIFIKYEPVDIKGNVPIIVGYTRRGELETCDLSKGDPHMLLAGQSGGGKSTALRCILTNLILYSNVHLHLIDLKNGVELRLFSESSKVAHFCKSITSARNLLQQLDMETEERYKKFYRCKVKDIKEYNEKFKDDIMDYEVIVADEFADLQDDKDSIKALESIGRKARACGIHMILSTQRPDAKVLTGSIKANVPTVLGLKTKDGTNSRIIIDDTSLKDLRGNGHGIFLNGGKSVEIQVPYIDPDTVEALIKHTFIEKNFDDEIIEPEIIDVTQIEPSKEKKSEIKKPTKKEKPPKKSKVVPQKL